MRRWSWIGVLLLVILAGVAIGVGSYNAGVNHGLAESGRAVQIVREVRPDGFFPFGFLLFPLFFFGFFWLMGGLFWRRRWGGPGGGRWEPGTSKSAPSRYEEWHRRQHEQATGDHPGAGGEPASV